MLYEETQAEIEKLQKFKAYFDFYYGCDIEILGIDENGNTTSFDEFYNCAIANAESIEHHIAHIIKTAKAESYKEFFNLVHSEFKTISDYQYAKSNITFCSNFQIAIDKLREIYRKLGGVQVYKSPIDLVVNQVQNLILEQQENQVFKAIQSVGVKVDKEELKKALKYDRQQYENGYNDGYTDGANAMLDKIKANLQSLIGLNYLDEMVGEDK